MAGIEDNVKNFLFAFCLTGILLLVVGCTSATSTSTPPAASIATIVPLFGGASSASRAVTTGTMNYNTVIFSFMAPSLTGFTTVASVTDGQTFTQSVMGVSLTLTAASFTGGTNGVASGVRYSGTLADGSGTYLIELDPTTKQFFYQEFLFINDAASVVNTSSPNLFSVYMTLTGTMDATNSCLATGSGGVFISSADFATRSIEVWPATEVYMGLWNAGSTVTGSGAAFYKDLQRSAPLAAIGAVAAPTQPNLANLASSVAYLKAVLSQGSTPGTLYFMIYKTSSDASPTVVFGAGAITPPANNAAAKALIPSPLWKAADTVFN